MFQTTNQWCMLSTQLPFLHIFTIPNGFPFFGWDSNHFQIVCFWLAHVLLEWDRGSNQLTTRGTTLWCSGMNDGTRSKQAIAKLMVTPPCPGPFSNVIPLSYDSTGDRVHTPPRNPGSSLDLETISRATAGSVGGWISPFRHLVYAGLSPGSQLKAGHRAGIVP